MSDPILSLGRKLVAALKADDDDLLSQWMAHHIAELIAECETVDPATSNAAKERCATAILELWAHRASLTGASKPFQDLVPIIETLRLLNPEGEHLFYRRMFPSSECSTSEDAMRWLTFSKNCDAIARMLIGIGIDKAAEHAGEAASEWVNVASKAGLIDFDIQISELLYNRLNERSSVDRRRVEDMKKRIEKLDSFEVMASELRAEFEKIVSDLESSDQPKDAAPE